MAIEVPCGDIEKVKAAHAPTVSALDEANSGGPVLRDVNNPDPKLRETFWYYQYVPFSSRKAHQLQRTEELLATRDAFRVRRVASLAAGYADQVARIDAEMKRIDAQIASIGGNSQTPRRGSLRTKLDEDPYDSVRLEDLRRMVGAWRIGRVTDVKAQRYATFEGGPSDAGFALTVNVNMAWMPVCGEPNRDMFYQLQQSLGGDAPGTRANEELARDARRVYTAAGANDDSDFATNVHCPSLGRLDADGRNANPTLLSLSLIHI